MPSPLPGMDPYIEAPDIWSDFHGDLAAEMRAELHRVLQPRYVARLTPHVTYAIVDIAERHNLRLDVGVWQPQPPSGTRASAVAVSTAAPIERVASSGASHCLNEEDVVPSRPRDIWRCVDINANAS